MAEIRPGARVWARAGNTVAHGVISRVQSADNDSKEPSVLIVLDNDAGVVVASTTSRGSVWDLEVAP